ncbi:MAG: GAF domain-containing protein [Anaerolineaceae bacterium]|nr:GAF domain-containing protein [Anaerolineaceae bacterium]
MDEKKELIWVITRREEIGRKICQYLQNEGYHTLFSDCVEEARKFLNEKPTNINSPALIVLEENLAGVSGLDLVGECKQIFPIIQIILLIEFESIDILRKMIERGVNTYFPLPVKPDVFLKSIREALETQKIQRKHLLNESRRKTDNLIKRLGELETLTHLGRAITGSLDVDTVLSAVVDAAVELTGAEEGSLMLVDDQTGELFIRAARNFDEDFIQTFRLPTDSSMLKSVLSSGQPLLLDGEAQRKIKTSYLVRGLVYMPLHLKNKVIGVLGVTNRLRNTAFSEHDVKLLSTLAGFAVIAIENARLYAETIKERNNLGSILDELLVGVVVLNQQKELLMVNKTIQKLFSFSEKKVLGKPFLDVFPHRELWGLLENVGTTAVQGIEIQVRENVVLSAYIAPIPDLGFVISLNDITKLKELDQAKSDFVSTVSHDLRSPLTAIMGYVDLIGKVGPVNEMQSEFIRRVMASVHVITRLIDDLLNLGRIESNREEGKENLLLNKMIRSSLDGYQQKFKDKALHCKAALPEDDISVFANPIQLHQLIENLLENAVKYTPKGGEVSIAVRAEEEQVIFQVRDTGIGIPLDDTKFIFEKFFRASNVGEDTLGTGLGLSIVASIVKNHQGRIWVDTKPDEGSTFTVMLPLVIN